MSRKTAPKTMPIYDKREWILCTCNECGQLNYVEPHGSTEDCERCGHRTEHSSIPYAVRNRGIYMDSVDVAKLRKIVPLLPVKEQ